MLLVYHSVFIVSTTFVDKNRNNNRSENVKEKNMEEKTNVKRCFKERFSELRAKSGLSQNKLGKALSLSPATIGYYENGSRLPDIETAARIARYFDVSADYLLGLSDAKSVEQDMKNACETTGLTQKAIENMQHIFSIFETESTS